MLVLLVPISHTIVRLSLLNVSRALLVTTAMVLAIIAPLLALLALIMKTQALQLTQTVKIAMQAQFVPSQ